MMKAAFGCALAVVLLEGLLLTGCSTALPWPDSPLYELPAADPNWVRPATKDEVLAALAGHYAHYDIVAYEGQTANGPLSTFIVSYGFTDLRVEGGELVAYDRFCHADYIANQPFDTFFSDAATQAIQPVGALCDVSVEGGEWRMLRPATPTLNGIKGDPNQPLSTDRNDPLISDDDHDGHPGVTVKVKLYGLIEGEIYIARREIFVNDLTLFSDRSLRGYVTDDSEQLVIGASLAILATPNNPPQRRDPGLNPILLIPVSEDFDSCENLMANRDALFPPAPRF